MSKNLWIIDTDAGVDDCQALVLGLTSNEIEVVAVTTVAGNIPINQVVVNTAETLKVCGLNSIPFHIGSQRPLISEPFTAQGIHGQDGLNNYWDSHSELELPQPSSKGAALAIIDYANMYAGELSIVTIGPLTNLALAVAIDPELPKKLKRVLVMGSAVHAKGNASFTSEFNIYCDPEAAHIVFERFPLLEIFPWETCIAKEHQFSEEFLLNYTSGTTNHGKFIKEITKIHEGASTVIFCDPITVAAAIDPSIVIKSTLREGFVELSGKYTRGMTVVNWKLSDVSELNEGFRKPNLLIAESLDIKKIENLLIKSIN